MTSTSLFNDEEILGLSVRYNAKKRSLGKVAVVDLAVDYWYSFCMMRRVDILKGLHDDIEKWHNLSGERLKWSYAFSFPSFWNGTAPYSLSTDFDLDKNEFFECHRYRMTMWNIYKNTDFSTKLLQRLGLDPMHFSFKNLAYKTVVYGMMENRVHLVYRN